MSHGDPLTTDEITQRLNDEVGRQPYVADEVEGVLEILSMPRVVKREAPPTPPTYTLQQ